MNYEQIVQMCIWWHFCNTEKWHSWKNVCQTCSFLKLCFLCRRNLALLAWSVLDLGQVWLSFGMRKVACAFQRDLTRHKMKDWNILMNLGPLATHPLAFLSMLLVGCVFTTSYFMDMYSDVNILRYATELKRISRSVITTYEILLNVGL